MNSPRQRWVAGIALAAALAVGCRGKTADRRSTEPVDPATAPQRASDAAPAAPRVADAAPPLGGMRFDNACIDGERATVAAVGDVLIHHELAKQAVSDDGRFRSIWAGVADLLARADVTYANLEGAIAPGLAKNARKVRDPGHTFDGVVYTGYPRFNYHPSLAADLLADGVDVVSTANNHTFDRELAGIDATIDALRDAGLKFTGTRRGDEGGKGGYAVTDAGPLKVAWIACAGFTNRHKDLDTKQLIRCDSDDGTVLRLIRKLSAQDDIDAVFVTPHWGKSYVHEPRKQEVDWAHEWLDAGATAVFGGHPHVLQPWEQYVTKDGRQTFVVYSLGNFVSHQPELPRRTTAIVYLGLTRDAEGVTHINGAGYVPVHVRQAGERFFAEAIDRVGGLDDARDHVASIFPAENLLGPDDPLVTNPECR
jgi:poly-gamma-glutamate synthesis protein (capsule biosynthesis protein)